MVITQWALREAHHGSPPRRYGTTWAIAVYVFVVAVVLVRTASASFAPPQRRTSSHPHDHVEPFDQRERNERHARCLAAAPPAFSSSSRHTLCEYGADLDTGPTECAHEIVAARTRSGKPDRERTALALCRSAQDAGPARCWLKLAAAGLPQANAAWRSVLTTICHQATDLTSATCFLELKRVLHGMMTPTPRVLAHAAADVCQLRMHDQKDDEQVIAAFVVCVTQSPRALAPEARVRLCHLVSTENEDIASMETTSQDEEDGNAAAVVVAVGDVVRCAKQLLQRGVSSELVVGICASAQSQTSLELAAPLTCALAAVHRLRWMHDTAITQLCADATDGTAPVECAASLHSWMRQQYPDVSTTKSSTNSAKDTSTVATMETALAQLCHRAEDAALMATCVKRLPVKVLSATQLPRICGALSTRESITCVSMAWQHLFTPTDTPEDSEPPIHALLDLCERAVSSESLQRCLLATAPSRQSTSGMPVMTRRQRIALCMHTSRASAIPSSSSGSPQDCFFAIQARVWRLVDVNKAVVLCAGATTIAPAICVNRLAQIVTPASSFPTVVTRLCSSATMISEDQIPSVVACYMEAPRSFSPDDRAMLCRGSGPASSSAPTCASVAIPRLGSAQNAFKAQLCAGARSKAPASCVNAAPLEMPSRDLLSLCREADLAAGDAPARCARGVPAMLRVPWHAIAQVCRGTTSLAPGICLTHFLRRLEPLTARLLEQCRTVTPVATRLTIASFAYECTQLLPNCRIRPRIHVLDQFGQEMPSLSTGSVVLSAVPDDGAVSGDGVLLQGVTAAVIRHGVALFDHVFFTTPGNYTLHVTMTGGYVAHMARVLVHRDVMRDALQTRCRGLFERMQCPRLRGPPTVAIGMQELQLSNRDAFVAMSCELMWSEQYTGLLYHGSTQTSRIYRVHSMAYQLFTGHGLPLAVMSAWDRLGVSEGANRSEIRRAYHQRSLDWHPDKWRAPSMLALRPRAHEIYTLITQAYHMLRSE